MFEVHEFDLITCRVRTIMPASPPICRLPKSVDAEYDCREMWVFRICSYPTIIYLFDPWLLGIKWWDIDSRALL